MPFRIRLSEKDQKLLIDLLADSYEYKSMYKLKNEQSIKTMGEYYLDAADKIRANNIEVRDHRNSFFTWLLDNFLRSGNKFNRRPEVQNAIEIITACSQNRYDQYKIDQAKRRLFKDLQ